MKIRPSPKKLLSAPSQLSEMTELFFLFLHCTPSPLPPPLHHHEEKENAKKISFWKVFSWMYIKLVSQNSLCKMHFRMYYIHYRNFILKISLFQNIYHVFQKFFSRNLIRKHVTFASSHLG